MLHYVCARLSLCLGAVRTHEHLWTFTCLLFAKPVVLFSLSSEPQLLGTSRYLDSCGMGPARSGSQTLGLEHVVCRGMPQSGILRPKSAKLLQKALKEISRSSRCSVQPWQAGHCTLIQHQAWSGLVWDTRCSYMVVAVLLASEVHTVCADLAKLTAPSNALSIWRTGMQTW